MQNSDKPALYLRWARCLVKFYPAGWRERYGEEMLMILEDSTPTLKTILNLLMHLFDAYLHQNLAAGRTPYMLQRMRSNELAIHGFAVIFWFAATFAIPNLYPVLHWYTSRDRFSLLMPLYDVFHYGTLLLILFILLSGLPIFLATSWEALMTRKYLALLFLLLSLVCPAIIIFLDTYLPIRIYNMWWNVFLLFLVAATNLAFIHMAVRNVLPSKRVTYSVLYLATPLPLIMLAFCASFLFYALSALMTENVISFIVSYPSGPGYFWDSFYMVCVMFPIMVVACSFSFISLLKGFQARRVAQNTL